MSYSEKAPLIETEPPAAVNEPVTDSKLKSESSIEHATSHVATGTGFLLGLWKPGQILSSDVPQYLRDRVAMSSKDYSSLLVVILAAVAVRFWDIANPPNVVHEEMIVGRRINHYFTGRFFYDNEPPFVGLIYAYIATLFGYPGQFDFDRITTYVGHAFPYMQLRAFTALTGVGLVIVTFLTLKLTGMSRRGATVGCAFVAFESTYTMEQRFIFYQPLVLLTLGVTVYLWKLLELQQPLSFKWNLTAIALGLSLGVTISSRNEGWYTVIWVFVASAYQLFWGFGNLRDKYPISRFFVSSGLRAVYFYMLPLLFSAIAIAVHVQLLPGAGEGTPFVSGPFQSSFINTPDSTVVSPVGIGSMVSIRHLKTNVYLHSHDAFFEGGSGQQHVTGYGHRDLNNIWVVENVSSSDGLHQTPFSVLQDRSLVRIRHFQTLRRLHTHPQKAPVSDNDYQFEVTAYGADGFPGDLNDVWEVEIVKQESVPDIAKTEWRAINSIVKFKHPLRRCYLFSHRVKLPASAFHQQEITCARNGVDDGAMWFVETNYHPLHPEDADKVSYRQASLMERVNEYHDLIESTDKALEQEKASQYSLPGYLLPLMNHGVAVYRQHHRQVLIVGNAVVWYGAIFGMVTYALFKIFTFLSLQRGWVSFENYTDLKETDHHVGGFLLLWFIHFFPLIFKTNTDIRDYLPVLYCSILASSRWLEYFSKLILRKSALVNLFYGLLIAGAISNYIVYSPFVYGTKMTLAQCQQLELGGLWDFSCHTYLSTEAEYDIYDQQNQVLYTYKAPPAEELVPATLVTTAENANPTTFNLRSDSPIVVDGNRPEIKRFVKKYEKLGRKKLNYVDLVDSDGNVVPIDAEVGTQTQKEEEEDEEPEEGLDTEIEEKLLTQWARITPGPSVSVNPEAAQSAKDQMEELSLEKSLKEEERSKLITAQAEESLFSLSSSEVDNVATD